MESVNRISGGLVEEDETCARPDSPSLCTLPITALRLLPPSSAAIWLAERPSDHSFLRSSTRSSVHDIIFARLSAWRSAGEIAPHAFDNDA
jgi:hypothetical protein